MEDIRNLLLDPENPRLPEDLRGAPQEELLRIMAEDYRALELGRSMADHGYFPEEPLAAIPERSPRLTVVEGNRRLAALRLLNNPDLAPPQQVDEWRQLARSQAAAILMVPVVRYESRDQIAAYMGFRHVSGVLKWEPLEKARFIDHLVTSRHLTFQQVFREIGSTFPTVRSNYVAYRIVAQAKGLGMDTSMVERDFSVLQRALNSPSIREYIGVNFQNDEKRLVRPIPPNKARNLRDLLDWMFGNGSRAPALKDSRQIDWLGEILENADALKALRSSRDVSFAHQFVKGEEDRLLSYMQRAAFFLQQAATDARKHESNEKIRAIAESCQKLLERIIASLHQRTPRN